MKNIITIGSILVFTLLTACATHHGAGHKPDQQSTPPSLVGSWQLIMEEIRIDGKAHPTFDPATRKMMKMFNDTHFTFVSIGDNRPRFSSYQLTPEQKVVAFDNFGGGGGRYTYEGGYLTEHVEYMNFPNYEGMSITFKITIDGDTMIQEGDYPITTLGMGEKDGYLYSVFKRIK